MKPKIVYVDDEPHNLTVLEAALPEDWEIHVYDNPLSALDALNELEPWVIISDQRMPGMNGIRFLETVKHLKPEAMRVLVTGFSDEDLVIESVRKAQVHDYIRKPWDPEDLLHRVQVVIDKYLLEKELKTKRRELEEQIHALRVSARALEESKIEEARMRQELEAWAPPFVLKALADPQIKFPMRKDLAVLTYDLVNSSNIHDVFIEGRAARSLILQRFSELVIQHGGWRESHAGDSAYAHFGLFKAQEKPCDAALAVAREFRVYLRNFNELNGLTIETGIGLHIAKNCLVDVHQVDIKVGEAYVTQKSFDSTSPDIDLVHRIEKFTHSYPGSNIAMSHDFFSQLSAPPHGIHHFGPQRFKGQKEATSVVMIPSDQLNRTNLGAA